MVLKIPADSRPTVNMKYRIKRMAIALLSKINSYTNLCYISYVLQVQQQLETIEINPPKWKKNPGISAQIW